MRWFRGHQDQRSEGQLKLILGLGNPGKQYERTRHNIGFMVVDEIARRHDATFKGSKHRADTARIDVSGTGILLAKPVTFMNESGFAARHLVEYFRIPLRDLVVVCDDIDLPFGSIRIRPAGSSGGNGGLKSIIRELGTVEFCRLRVGVSRPPGSTVKHVLGPFAGEQAEFLPALVDVAANATLDVLEHGVTEAMNTFNKNWMDKLRSGPTALSP